MLFARVFFVVSLVITGFFIADVLTGDNLMPARPARSYPADTVLLVVAYMVCATVAAFLAGREPRT